ncbi:MAG TPA: hypothetical protein VGI12_00660 [Vicinamibacterales bacterium]
MQDRLARAAPFVVTALATAVSVVGVTLGSHVASGADAYGYVSQARLMRHGTLQQTERLVRTADWPDAAESLAPLGYRPAVGGFTNVPTYAPGLPLLMAAAALVAGPCMVYGVVPLAAALLVLLTYRLARCVADPAVAVAAAILLATSPVFLFMTLWPMSDVPAAACWIAAMLCAASTERWRPLATAALTALAILIRPNLVHLAAVPAGISLYMSSRVSRAATGRAAVLLAAGLASAIAVVLALNRTLYGSPVASGYGAVSGLYAMSRIGRNAALHASWLQQSQGLYLTAAVAGLIVHLRRGFSDLLVWGGLFAVLLWAAYLPYHTYTEWWYLRFLLPALPVVFVLAADGVAAVAGLAGQTVRAVALAIFVAAASTHAIHFALANGVFAIGEQEQRFVEVAAFVATALPADAVLISGEHSGSIRYYSGRETIRYDRMRGTALDAAVRSLSWQHLHVYAVLDRLEEPGFRARFGGQAALARLADLPMATLDSPVPVDVFDFAPVAADAVATRRIAHLPRSKCFEPDD